MKKRRMVFSTVRLSSLRTSKLSQIWVETVTYTLIGLAIIGILLAATKPKIDKLKDKMIIEQTIDSMNKIDSKIYEVQRAPGNKRVLNVKISKGRFIIDAAEDKLKWVLKSKYQYSEEGTPISLGNLNILTTAGSPWVVELWVNYSVNLTYEGKDVLKELTETTAPYSLKIENFGSSGGKTQIDLRV